MNTVIHRTIGGGVVWVGLRGHMEKNIFMYVNDITLNRGRGNTYMYLYVLQAERKVINYTLAYTWKSCSH